uniref:Retrovirus-related Pol polyprotein from transposon TNT 1-94 n=1 Tax=Cajanus cajan TaxID=3821 RepID=A0A151S9Y4_CAJCA|nr:Retrovirus-related Pol polyprotein from transposon TNT 1-94 [Cajanus cajan]
MIMAWSLWMELDHYRVIKAKCSTDSAMLRICPQTYTTTATFFFSDSIKNNREQVLLHHCCLGHPSFRVIKLLFPSLFNKLDVESLHCEVCELAKHPKLVIKPTIQKKIVSRDVAFLEQESYFHQDHLRGETIRKEDDPPLMLPNFSLGPQVGTKSETDPEKEAQSIEPTKFTQLGANVRFGKNLVYIRKAKAIPESVHVQESNPTLNEELESNSPPLYEDLDIPIALRKETKKCTNKPRYPLANYLSFKHFSPTHKAFLTSLNTTTIPTFLSEALIDRKWKQAMDLEMEVLEKNSTWELVTLPNGKKPVGCKWTYTIKYKADGSIERYTARLVAKGFTQTYGVDYLETFAPVAKMNTVRVILSLVANYGWNLQQFDVKNVFLHGELKEEIYIKLPPGYDGKTLATTVCKLKKALYGLKQSPLAWFGRFTKVMISLGFKQSQGDHTLFVKHSKVGGEYG